MEEGTAEHSSQGWREWEGRWGKGAERLRVREGSGTKPKCIVTAIVVSVRSLRYMGQIAFCLSVCLGHRLDLYPCQFS